MYKYFVAYLTTKSSSVSRIHRHIVHTSWWKARRWIDTGFVGENVWYKAQCLDWVLSQRDNSQKYQKKEEHDERWGWRWQLLHRFLLLLYPIQHVHYQWRQLWIAKRLGLFWISGRRSYKYRHYIHLLLETLTQSVSM